MRIQRLAIRHFPSVHQMSDMTVGSGFGDDGLEFSGLLGTSMKLIFAQVRVLSALTALTVITHFAAAAPFDWTGASGLNVLWSTPDNWTPLGPPALNDDARFFDAGAAGDIVTINSTVSADTTIRTLWFGQTNGIHNLLIEPGVTLTVRGTHDNGYGRLGSDPNATAPTNGVSTLYVGTKSEVAAGTIVTATISGENGTLSLDNTNNEVNIRQVFGGSGGAHRSILNMSGLGTFRANLSRIRVGDGEAGAIRRAEGQLILAKTNRITLTGPSVAEDVQLLVGNNDVNNNGNGSISHLVLGQDNILNVDHVLVGARKQQGNMRFLETLVAPTLIMRGSDGVSRVTAIRIGDESDQANSGNPTTGRIDLGVGTSDIRADTIIVGKGQQQTGREGIGFLTVGAGTVDVNTMEVAYQNSETANNRVDGTVTFNGTTVQVNNLLRLARSAGSSQPRNATLNINGGSVTVNGAYRNEGTVIINVTNGSLTLPAGSQIVASNLNLDGGTISNAGSIRVISALTVANGGTFLGNPIFDMGNSGSANWNVQGAPGGVFTVSNALQGSGSIVGDLTQAPGASVSPGGSTAGTLTINGNATLDAGTLRFDLASSSLAINDRIDVTGTLTLVGTNDVHLTALEGNFGIGDAYTLLNAGTLIGDGTYFRTAGLLAQSRYTFSFETGFVPSGISLLVGGSGPASLTWVGGVSGNTWNLKGVANWTMGAGPEQFFSLDSVTFNDTGSASPAVNLVGRLTPSAITVDNATRNYAFTGTGGVEGAPLTKQGAGSLNFGNNGDNSFSGAVTIQDGAVSFSNSGLNTFANGLAVNGGSVTFSGSNTNVITGGTLTVAVGAAVTAANAGANNFGAGSIQLDGTLTINQAVDSTLEGAISGLGALNKAGTGTLTLANNNTGLTTPVQVDGGTIRAGVANAIGSAGANIAAGGALNINGQNLLTVPVTVSGAGPDGNGAIVNTANPQANALGNVTLTDNTTFGGSGPWNTDPVLNRGRWDIRNGSLSTMGQPYDLTKTGSNQVTLAGVTVDALLSDIDVQRGLLALEGATTSLGETTDTLTVRAGATLSFFDTTTAWDKRFVLFGNGVTPNLFNYNGANTVAGSLTLNGDCVFGAAPSDRGMPAGLTLSGAVIGSGKLIKTSGDRLILSGTYTYTGDTLVDAGTLALAAQGSIASSPNITVNAGATIDASASFDAALTIASGQTLRGNGTVTGNLTANAGSTLSPGVSIGALSVSGEISLAGTTVMELDAMLDTNDVLRSGSFIFFGGTLQLMNLAGNLNNGDSFKLFDAAGYADSFASIIPATPGTGLNWDTSTLNTDGTLRVTSGSPRPRITGTSLSGGNFVFSGIGGTPNGAYRVLASADASVPLANWTSILTGNFDGSGNFSVSVPVSASPAQRFFVLQAP